MTLRQQARLRRFTRRQVVSGGAGLGLTPLLARYPVLAAPASQGTPTVKIGGTLKVCVQADPTALDPQKQSLTAIWHVIEQIYDGLTRIITPDLSVQPALAESWDISDDGITYTFHLRSNVVFHDGTPLKASDVKFTFE